MKLLRRQFIASLSLWVVALSTFGMPGASATSAGKPIFTFHTDEFWLNLHQFLYVLGRAANNERDATREAVAKAPADETQGLAKLKPADQTIWREVVRSYADGLSKRDAVFDDPMPLVARELSRARDARTLKGVKLDASIVAGLERAAPIYRRVWWPDHRASNRSLAELIKRLASKHGTPVLAFITRSYNRQWAGFDIHLSAFANWAGAYSTEGNLLVLSSKYERFHGNYGLEIAFHEGMHQWDESVAAELAAGAQKTGGPKPDEDLSHTMIFYTAGEAVRHVIPDHIPYAEKFGNWQRGLAPFKAALDRSWRPFLDGKSSRDDALAALIRSNPRRQ